MGLMPKKPIGWEFRARKMWGWKLWFILLCLYKLHKGNNLLNLKSTWILTKLTLARVSCYNGYQYFQKSFVFKQDFFINTIFIAITQPLSSCIKHFPNFISANKYTRTPVCTQCPYTCKTRPNEMKKSENCLQGLLHSWYAKVAISEE